MAKKKIDLDKVASNVVLSYNKAKAFKQPYQDIFIKCYKEYRFYRAKQKYPWRANIPIPRAFQVVETITPPTAMSMFAVSPFITILPLHNTPEEYAKKHEVLIDSQLKEQDFALTAVQWIKEALIYGTSILKLYPYFVNGQFLYPKAQLIDIFDFYISEDYFSYQIHRTLKDKAEVQNLWKRKIYNDNALKVLKSEYEEAADWQLASELRLPYIAGGLSKSESQPKGKVELLEYWGKYDWGDGIPKESVITVANQKYVVRMRENPIELRPFVPLVSAPVPHEFFGIGLIEPILGLVDELNTKRNQRLDNVNIALNKMFIIDKFAQVELPIISKPGGVIKAGNVDAVRELQISDITRSYNVDIEMIDRDIQAITAAYPYLAGAPPQRKETAAGIMSLQNAASARPRLMVALLNQVFLKQLGILMMKINQKYFSGGTIPQIIDRGTDRSVNMLNVLPNELQGSFQVYPVASADEGFGNRQVRQVNLIKIIQFIASIPPEELAQSGYKRNLVPLLKRLLYLSDIKEVDTILQELPPQPAPQPEIQPAPPGIQPAPPGIPPTEGLPTQEQPIPEAAQADVISKLLGNFNR